jgi:hypothetical protein
LGGDAELGDEAAVGVHGGAEAGPEGEVAVAAEEALGGRYPPPPPPARPPQTAIYLLQKESFNYDTGPL